jgi:Protein of unknown function (DUF3429)
MPHSFDAGSKALLKLLPFAGALPFIVAALALWFGIDTLPYLGSLQSSILAYGLAILSFMAGVHWGQYLSGLNARANLLITSNFATVLSWLGYILLSPAQFACLLIVLFLALLLIDRQLETSGHIQRDYMRTRTGVTLLVIVSLAVIAYFSNTSSI